MITSLTLAFVALQGATSYVPDDYPSIQSALNAVSAGDTVVVRAGTYLETALNFAGKDIHLRSEEGPAATIIDGMALDSVFDLAYGEGPDCIVQGFTITNGKKWDGGGISIEPDALGNPSSPTILDCIISGNTGDGGAGGIHIGPNSNTLVKNCLIENNTVVNYYGGGGAFFDCTPTFENCTIRDNTVPAFGGGFAVWGTTQLTMVNCIMSGNVPDVLTYVGGPPPTPIMEYCLIEGGTGQGWFSATCIDAAPDYASGPQGDAYLAHVAAGQGSDSPAIDAGDPASTFYSSTRTDGGFDVGTVDIGFHYPLTGPELTVSALVAGSPATIVIRNNAASDQLVLGYSFAPGGPLNTQYGTVYLGQPYLLSPPIAAGADGVATLVKSIPAVAAGRTVRAQGLNQTQGVLTNPIETIIQ